MKKILYIIVLITQFSFAQDAFEKGNQYYQKGNFQQAISNYESVLVSGNQSAELYFNLGNCYYKLHKVAPAIYNFEKALQLNPNDQEIQTNLDFAKRMTVDDIKEIPQVGFNKLLQNLVSIFNYDTWASIAVIFAFLFLLSFVGYYFSPSAVKKRIFFTSMFVIFIGILVSVSSAISEKSRISNEKAAIVFAEKASVKSEPKLSATETILLHEGTKVFILESIANWKKVQLTDETTGWISDEAIKEL
ncbi:tetratricopeptide repeat protein [Flavobacterium sp. SUN052]|uniref:tetratricopeptide repeat protein n=1 Tax=Flavobacterium sp. SUN052 TaxID=3002441 RepID=UPI00237DAB0E|nr:tetratricopeptide repeat protein [Flavobacterium sp. SUN052]MEC4004290.1 tetratricopeptide repeat protein [Flavobacterium sp. SUN052]